MKKNTPGCCPCEEGPPTAACFPCGLPIGDLDVAYTYRNFSNVVTTEQNTLVHTTSRPSWMALYGAPDGLGHYWEMTARRQSNDGNNFTFPWYRFGIWCSGTPSTFMRLLKAFYGNNSPPDTGASFNTSAWSGLAAGESCDPLYLKADCCNPAGGTTTSLALGVPMFQITAP